MKQPSLDERLTYRMRAWMANDGACRLRVWRPERVIVVTELDDNPGMSVTNAAEEVAFALERRLSVDVLDGTYTLVEHYPPRAGHPADFDLVTFAGRGSDGVPYGVTWRPISPALDWLRFAVLESDMAGSR